MLWTQRRSFSSVSDVHNVKSPKWNMLTWGQFIYSCRAVTQEHTHTHTHTEVRMCLTLIVTFNHTLTHTKSHTQDPCESKTFLSAQVQAHPPNRGVCTFIHGPFFGIWLLYNYQPRTCWALFLFFPSVHYIVLPALLSNAEDCDLNGFWVLLIHRRHISHTKVAPKRLGEFHRAERKP